MAVEHERETLHGYCTNRMPLVLWWAAMPGLDRRARCCIEARVSTATDDRDSADMPVLVEFHPQPNLSLLAQALGQRRVAGRSALWTLDDQFRVEIFCCNLSQGWAHRTAYRALRLNLVDHRNLNAGSVYQNGWHWDSELHRRQRWRLFFLY